MGPNFAEGVLGSSGLNLTWLKSVTCRAGIEGSTAMLSGIVPAEQNCSILGAVSVEQYQPALRNSVCREALVPPFPFFVA